MEMMHEVFVFEKKLYKAETNGPKMIKFGAKCRKMVAMRRSCCDQDITWKAANDCCIASKA